MDNISNDTDSICNIDQLHFSFGPKILLTSPQDTLISKTTPIYRAIAINQILSLAQSTKKGKLFPGTHPVNLTLDNIHLLKDYPYFLSLKIDGTR
jgi:hypothetical protein